MLFGIDTDTRIGCRYQYQYLVSAPIPCDYQNRYQYKVWCINTHIRYQYHYRYWFWYQPQGLSTLLAPKKVSIPRQRYQNKKNQSNSTVYNSLIKCLVSVLVSNKMQKQVLPMALDTAYVPFTRQQPIKVTQPPRSSILCFSSYTVRQNTDGTLFCVHIGTPTW